MTKFRVTFDGRRGRRRCRVTLTQVSFSDGDGLRLKRVWFSDNLTRAQLFSQSTASTLADDLTRRFRYVNVTIDPVEVPHV